MVAFIFVFLLRLFVVELYYIPSSSMMNTLKPGDNILVSKMSNFIGLPPVLPMLNLNIGRTKRLKIKEFKRGEIAVFVHEELGNMQIYVKRIVALAGDYIMLEGNNIFVNGVLQPLPDSSITRQQKLFYGPAYRDLSPKPVPKEGMTIVINKDNYNSYKEIIEEEGNQLHKVGNLIWINGRRTNKYKFRKNYYFVLGDNRFNSNDSRYWGFLCEDDIIGRPIVLLWSDTEESRGINLIE